ncbi:N-6 DNA methylase [Streptomyces scopuliridis]|uniref:N-6 DNA methylase n=1 Tax=Streptomyces scopuliridis TaxID=452529 RepID=A0ACD4ZN50_9ACTN|nr:N-6 DNA methylase [Streptomyces scopuliridis]WSB99231.1 N-6 DNA methylase [Streptomyces scopuliridis]WSC07068.1 N-6 DNA methylase [Streptomyces scopuliridis]
MTTAPQTNLEKVLARLIDRKPMRSEATLQADVRQLLLDGGLNLDENDLSVDLETQVGDGRRIDIEVGFTAIETKKDLRSAATLKDAVKQLGGYVHARTEQVGQRYVGILTDGADWRAYSLSGDNLVQVSRFEVKQRTSPTELLRWLEGVLATAEGIRPTPDAIESRLGADSVSHKLDRATLTALYEEHKGLPTVKLKRELWARLLRSALGTQFEDSDVLFIEHTLLVNSAEIIAHLVLGIDVRDMQPSTLVLGQRFAQAQIYGVVESDFFGWVIEVPGGEGFVRTVARRLARYDWAKVEHDVLKVLYESVIAAETRKKQGEYYTPDWLAEKVVTDAVTAPLDQRVLDPSCGSGTFLFHAVRRYLQAAEDKGRPLRQTLIDISDHVAGIDLHPVAVALARVTYLLAIGRSRLMSDERGPIRVPVYLGDSVQWQQRTDLLDHGHLVIRTEEGGMLFENELRFSEHLLADAGRFDTIVNELADRATNRPPQSKPSLTTLFNRLGITSKDDQQELTENFRLLCHLVDNGRDHIWSYYVRNLARPMWLSREENRVDVLVGNPPWLSYRHMSEEMQELFKDMAQSRKLWRGDEVATHQDLSGLFIARAIQQYLAVDGTFAFVVPNPVLDRPYWSGFRAGHYPDPNETVKIAFSGSWDLRRLRPHFFPRGSAVVFGRRMHAKIGEAAQGNTPVPLGKTTDRWTGKVPGRNSNWPQVEKWIKREEKKLRYTSEDLISSPYRTRFENGATIYPRYLFFVEMQEVGPLGLGGGRTRVRSERSSTEKAPWKNLPDLEGVIEKEFIRRVLLGESILPFRVLNPRLAVLPIEGSSTLLSGEHEHLERYPDLAEWWRIAEQQWIAHRNTKRLTLEQQLNFRHKLTEQLPGTPLRVVYGKAGMHVSAALVDDPNAIIDHKLYWGTVATLEEGMYLCAILNSPALTEIVRPMMSYGKDERDIDKAVWQLPIPEFDPLNTGHLRLAEIGAAQAEHISELVLDESKSFVKLRQVIRSILADSPEAEELDQLVRLLLE